MALDGIILSKVKEKLCAGLPMRINRISQASSTEIIFNIHSANIRTNLVFSFHSVYNHLCLSDRNYTTYTEASTFIMVLRKYLLNGIIDSIEQKDYDRYLLFHIRSLNDLYDEKEYLLSIELMGKYANMVLVDAAENKIIDALKKIPPYENNNRTILQGARFTLPAPQDKQDPFSHPSVEINESFVKQFQGFSKLLENEVRFRMKERSFEDIMKEISLSDHLYLTAVNDEYEYHLIPLLHLNKPYEQYELFAGFEELYYERDEKERIRNVTDDIFRFTKRQIKHYDAKIVKLNISLQEALQLQQDRQAGDLLYMQEDLNRKGLKEITLQDFDNEPVTIRLDPRYSLKDNANRYYQTYQKKRKGQIFIKEQLQIAQMEDEYFRAIQEQLGFASYEDALQIKEELVRYGYLKEKKKGPQKKKKKVSLYQLTYKGHRITFGKNNIQNDHLTFDYAGANDTWFHAKGYHGSHVVIDTSDPDEEMIRVCANLAAYNSKARYSSSVGVDYCLVRNIKKVKGAKNGFVTIRNYKTIYIDPIKDNSLDIISI